VAVDRRKLRSISDSHGDFPVAIKVERLKQFGWNPPADLTHQSVGVLVEDVPDETLEAIVKDNIRSANPARAARLAEVIS
jgi:hypothetical protein